MIIKDLRDRKGYINARFFVNTLKNLAFRISYSNYFWLSTNGI